MLPGPMSDSSAEPLGWRIANALAIAAPYLLAGALFAILYLEPTVPPAHAMPGPSSAPVADLATPGEPAGATPVEPASAPTAAPANVPAPTAPSQRRPAAQAPPTSVSSAIPGPAALPKETGLPVPAQPVPVEATVAETMKLPGDALTYPPAARDAHIQGVVVLAAIIGPDGAVQSVQAVSGPALLEVAALAGVRSWRYRPWLVQGKPVSFATQIIIDFKLDAKPSQ